MSAAPDDRSPPRQPDLDQAADHYGLLGVRYDATPVEITRAYRRAMKLNHPDRHQGAGQERAEQRSRRINAAYATLSRTDRRRAYDRTLQSRVAEDALMGRYVNGGFTPDDIRRAKAEATRPYRRRMTAAEEQELRQAHLATYVSLGIAFGGFLAAIVLVLVLLGIMGAVLRLLF